MAGNYEVDNPEARAILQDIARKIGGALKSGWGFLLMIFEYESGGAHFYASNAERDDVVQMVREWLGRQEGLVELNPDHTTTQKMREQWAKLMAVVLYKYREAFGPEIVITSADLTALTAAYKLPSVVADDRRDGLHLRLVDEPEGRALAQQAGGGPS